MRVPEELARLVAKRFGEVQVAREETHLAEPVGEVLLGLRPPPITGICLRTKVTMFLSHFSCVGR